MESVASVQRREDLRSTSAIYALLEQVAWVGEIQFPACCLPPYVEPGSAATMIDVRSDESCRYDCVETSLTRQTEDALTEIERRAISVPAPDSVREYLISHADTIDALRCITAEVFGYFANRAQVSLELYRDPEVDDEYLTVYVRQEKYDANILEQIDIVSALCESSIEDISGWILLTTDFRPPR